MRRVASIASFLLISLFAVSAACPGAGADTVVRTNGQDIKGVVVEEYKDRIVLSTADGEIKLMKSDIRSITLDDEDSNLIRLAEKAKNDGDYPRAIAYYQKVLLINPASKAAKDAIIFLQLRAWQKQTAGKAADVEKQAMIDRGGAPYTKTDEDAELAQLKRTLQASTGMSLSSEASLPKVEQVRGDSPAAAAGIRRGDIIVAVWGRLTGYMSPKEVIDLILNKSSAEIRCTIEREAKVFLGPRGLLAAPDRIGATLGIGPDGLAVFSLKKDGNAGAAGLEKNDVIVAIDGKPTRYLQLARALGLIRAARGEYVVLKFRREVMVWKGGV